MAGRKQRKNKGIQ